MTEGSDSGDAASRIRMIAYHEAGHALAAFLEDVPISKISLRDEIGSHIENNGSVDYEDEQSIPDKIRIDLAIGGDASVAVFEGSGTSAPLRDDETTDFHRFQEHVRRIFRQDGKEPTSEEVKAYYQNRRDVMIERFSTPKNRLALKNCAEQLQAGSRVVDTGGDPEKPRNWHCLFGGQALEIFQEAMRDTDDEGVSKDSSDMSNRDVDKETGF